MGCNVTRKPKYATVFEFPEPVRNLSDTCRKFTDRLIDKWSDGKVQTEDSDISVDSEASCVRKRRRGRSDWLAIGAYEREVTGVQSAG